MCSSVIKILMRRDGLSRSQAEEAAREVREEMMEAIASGDFAEAEDILLEAGLELDYIEEILL